MKVFRVRFIFWMIILFSLQAMIVGSKIYEVGFSNYLKENPILEGLDIIIIFVGLLVIFYKVVISSNAVGVSIGTIFEWNKIARVTKFKIGPLVFLKFHSKFDDINTCVIPLFVYRKKELISLIQESLKLNSIKNDTDYI
ncbi:hypothetical protein SHI21_20390 [Bacteriovorax sp. PP10]|uniref:Uncharacterized protein n=1 Tax=Bacteriovorax antarcticus TaxID=3088717 RepID=A0ABU5VZV1_9BACT|nr:hypothetical protein [Bacteriovorax sp. PP10]MEA9358608.1 hypothetical protein [Bacteriovorax sp. PP10]